MIGTRTHERRVPERNFIRGPETTPTTGQLSPEPLAGATVEFRPIAANDWRSARARVSQASIVAFGQYLRDLRERAGLSLRRACELTVDSPEPIDKGALSRLERGLQIPSIFKLGPLSRVYDVPADALIERMELDRWAERRGLRESPNRGHDELVESGRAALARDGGTWDAYVLFRQALRLAPPAERIKTWMNLVSTIRALGRNHLALHELRAIERIVSDDAQRAWLHERMTTCCRALGDLGRAAEHAQCAVRFARAAEDLRVLAYALVAKAHVAIDQEEWSDAVRSLTEALDSHRDGAGTASMVSAVPGFEAQTRLFLADCYIHLDRLGAARRVLLTAKHIGKEHDLTRSTAYADLLLGRLAHLDGDPDQAFERWRKAAAAAARLRDKRLAFTLEMELFRLALERGNAARARAARARLDKLAPWIPQDVPAMKEYRTLTGSGAPGRARVAKQGGTDD